MDFREISDFAVYCREKMTVFVFYARFVSPGGILSVESLHARLLHGHKALSQGTVLSATSVFQLMLEYLAL